MSSEHLIVLLLGIILLVLTAGSFWIRKLALDARELRRQGEILVKGLDATTTRLDQVIYVLQTIVGELRAIRGKLQTACDELGAAGYNLVRLSRAIAAFRLALLGVKGVIVQYQPILEKIGLSDCIRELKFSAECVHVEGVRPAPAAAMLPSR